jgi:hypothetical protein
VLRYSSWITATDATARSSPGVALETLDWDIALAALILGEGDQGKVIFVDSVLPRRSSRDSVFYLTVERLDAPSDPIGSWKLFAPSERSGGMLPAINDRQLEPAWTEGPARIRVGRGVGASRSELTRQMRSVLEERDELGLGELPSELSVIVVANTDSLASLVGVTRFARPLRAFSLVEPLTIVSVVTSQGGVIPHELSHAASVTVQSGFAGALGEAYALARRGSAERSFGDLLCEDFLQTDSTNLTSSALDSIFRGERQTSTTPELRRMLAALAVDAVISEYGVSRLFFATAGEPGDLVGRLAARYGVTAVEVVSALSTASRAAWSACARRR